jgi:Holliday junction resolvase-like predicted endonuclease
MDFSKAEIDIIAQRKYTIVEVKRSSLSLVCHKIL